MIRIKKTLFSTLLTVALLGLFAAPAAAAPIDATLDGWNAVAAWMHDTWTRVAAAALGGDDEGGGEPTALVSVDDSAQTPKDDPQVGPDIDPNG